MAKYVDGFVIPMPKKNLTAYKKIAKKAGKIWMEHGALDYYECVGEDMKSKFGISFPKLAGTKPSETVVFSWITYISPMVTKVGGLQEDRVPFIMILVGLGMFFGNILGGKLADTISPTKAAIACFTTMALTLVTVYFTAHIPSLAYVMAFVTGLVAFTIGSPLQMMLITSAKGSENIAAAAGQASFNIGNTLGAYLGGIPITLGYAYNSPVLVGVGMAGIGAMLATVYLKKFLVR